ncbi:unnamed protein product, partial [Gulo gulo]
QFWCCQRGAASPAAAAAAATAAATAAAKGEPCDRALPGPLPTCARAVTVCPPLPLRHRGGRSHRPGFDPFMHVTSQYKGNPNNVSLL